MAEPKPISKILTSNRLTNGETLFYTAAGAWSPFVTEAKIVTTQEGVDELTKIGAAAYAANQVIDVSVIDATADGGVKPKDIREIIRATGPTVRLDLNKSMSPAGK